MKKIFLMAALVGLFAVSFMASAKAEGRSASDLIADMEKTINSVTTSMGQITPENQEAAKERLTAMKNNLAAAKKAKERMGQSDCDSACQQAQMILIENASQYVEALKDEIAQLGGKDVQYGEQGSETKDQDKKEVSEDTSKTGGEGSENKLEPPTDKEDAHAGQSSKEVASNSQNNTSSGGAKGESPINSTADDKETTGNNNDTTNNYTSKQ